MRIFAAGKGRKLRRLRILLPNSNVRGFLFKVVWYSEQTYLLFPILKKITDAVIPGVRVFIVVAQADINGVEHFIIVTII